LKKKRFLPDFARSPRLTWWVDRFFPGYLQSWIFNKTDPAKTLGHLDSGLTCRAGPSLITMIERLNLMTSLV
jgi:hypothetical protein